MRNLFPKNTSHMLAAMIGCVTLTACGGGGGSVGQEAAAPYAPTPAPVAVGAPAPVTTASQVESNTVSTTHGGSSGFLLTPATVLTPATIGPDAQITDIRFENTGAAQSGLPVTFGHVFASGAVLGSDALVGKLPDGTLVPLQVDIKARHVDGSIRHAVISAVLPSLAASQTQTMALVKTAPYAAPAAADPSALLASGFTAAANVTLAGQQYSASADALLKGGKFTVWLTGAIANEWHVSAPLMTAQGVAHPHLTARFAIRSYNGSKKTRVDVTIENNWAFEAAPQNFVYDAEVVVGGAPVFTKAGLTHYHHARWRKVFWWGQEPQVHVKHNTAYLIGTKAVPNYDQSIVFADTTLAAMKTSWTGSKTEVMGVGEAMKYMPSTGGRPDIGLLPSWSATYLLSMDKRAKEVSMGTADLAGSWSSHYRNRITDRPVSVIDFPYMTILGTKTDTLNKITKQYEAFPSCPKEVCTTPYSHDTAHQPAFAYLPYIVSGDYYYLEELQFWTMWNVFSSNPGYRSHDKGLISSNQVRAQAWALRSLGEAAYITPDNDPLKSHFQSFVKNNIDWYNAQYSFNPAANKLGIFAHGSAMTYNGGTSTSPWMDDFFTSAAGHIVELGFTDAAPLLAYKSKFAIGRMIDPDACWIRATAYTIQVRASGTAPLFETMGESYRATFASDPTQLACNSTEMSTFLGLKSGEMVGYASITTGYPANMQPALAYAADGAGPDGVKAWNVFANRSVKPNYSKGPQFAIVPRVK